MQKSIACVSGIALVMMSQVALADPCTPVFDLALGTPGADGGIGKLYPTDYFTPGTARRMLVGGGFNSIGGVAGTSGVAVWDGSAFAPLSTGIAFSGTAEVNAFQVYGGKLYIGGQFTGSVDGVASRGVIRWNGSAFEAVHVNTAPAAFSARAFEVFQGDLYVGGSFAAIGSINTSVIAKLNPTGDDYLPLAFSTASTAATVFDMVVFDDGSGEKLYVCGNFTSMRNDDGLGNPVTVAGTRWVARWTGTEWESVGGGITSGSPANNARDLLVYDDGTGPALYLAGGRMSTLPDLIESPVYRWDGFAWKAIVGFHDAPLDIASTVNSFGLVNDGPGTTILAQTRFAESGGANARQVLMKLEAGRFELVPGATFDSLVSEIQQFDDGAGRKTWLGGFFTTVNATPATRLARISGCTGGGSSCPADFDQSGGLTVQDIFDFLNAWFAGCP